MERSASIHLGYLGLLLVAPTVCDARLSMLGCSGVVRWSTRTYDKAVMTGLKNLLPYMSSNRASSTKLSPRRES